MLRIAKENDFVEYMLPGYAGYGRSKDEVLKRAAHRNAFVPQSKEQDEGYTYRNCPSAQ